MELASFARVVAHLEGGRRRIGTGYRLAEGRVLTAGHVVVGATSLEVEIDRAPGGVRTIEATVAWPGETDAGLDAVLLQCATEDAERPAFTHLARSPLARAAPWQSRGCARAAVAGSGVGDSMAGLRGTAFPFAAGEDRFELAAEAQPRLAEDWSGISGAPVFVHGRIQGVIREAPVDFEGRRLYATPMHRLLAEEGFVAALGFRAEDKWRDLLEEVGTLLAGDREAAEGLAERSPAWRRGFADDNAPGLARAVCEQSAVDEALLAMHAAHRALLGRGRPAAARTVEEVLARVVPVLYDQQMVYELPPRGGVVLRVPVATSTIAEIVMAGADARAYSYLPQQDRENFPEPAASVAGFPEPGIDPDGARGYKDFVDHLANTFVSDTDRHALQRQDRMEEKRYGDLARLVDDELAWQAEHGAEGLRRYFLFDSDFARQHAPFLERLRDSLPALRLVELTGGDLPGERRLCRPLRELLYRAETSRRSGE
ncbi:MAG: trypsin-like peptidase domain-containing protein [bacterium]|nr:trypsin-like peptidase domain-containing protein [bacterium]